MGEVPSQLDESSGVESGTSDLVVPLDQLTLDDLPRVGGKNASLGEMLRELRGVGVRVPDGFALTVDAFHLHLRRAEIESAIEKRLGTLDVTDTQALSSAGREIRESIIAATLPE